MYRNIHTMEKSTIAQKQNTTNFGVNIFLLINYKYNIKYNNDNYNKFHNSNQPMGSENKL